MNKVTLAEMMTPEMLGKMSLEDMRSFIDSVERFVSNSGGEIVTDKIPILHHFADKVYAREMRMAQGELVVGKIHRFENLNILSQGEVSVLSIDGVKRIKAPYSFVASAGVKRVIYAHEDAIWTVIHGTDLSDVADIEEKVIAKDYKELLTGGK